MLSVQLFVAGLAPTFCSAQETTPQKGPTTTIVQMSDPQFFFPEKRRASKVPNETLAREAIRFAERVKPAFVVVTGDMVQHRGNKQEIATFWRLFKTLDPKIPLYCVPGNHDVTYKSESLAEYRKNFGKDYYSLKVDPDRFLVLNSVLLRSEATRTKASADQWEWLEAELKKAKKADARYIVVFLHHPLFAMLPHEPDGFYNLPLKARKRLFRLFKQYEVDAVFAGHYHRNLVNKHQGIQYVITGSVCAPIVANDPEGVRLITLGPDGITHRYVKRTNYKSDRKYSHGQIN